MIGQLTGRVLNTTLSGVLLDVGGVGYELEVPISTLVTLPAPGQVEPVTLITHLAIKEDAHTLFGFATHEERIAFRELLKVQGIGAKTALAVLSGVSVAELLALVEAQDAARLAKTPGIGPKTAERAVLALKNKLAKALPTVTKLPSLLANTHHQEIEDALAGLGYSAKEARSAVAALPADISLAGGLRQALASFN